MAASPYSIGSDVWPGLSKLTEEMGEVGQVIGKIIGAGGLTTHWDGGPELDERLADEIADVQAATDFVIAKCGLDATHIAMRRREKHLLFERWHADQTVPPTPGPKPSSEGDRFIGKTLDEIGAESGGGRQALAGRIP